MEPPRPTSVRPSLRVLYLLAVTVGAFGIHHLAVVGSLAAVQIAVALVVGVGLRPLLRVPWRLKFFFTLLLLAYLFLPPEPGLIPRVWVIPFFRTDLVLNLTGGVAGLAMCLRVLTVVVCSMLVRASGKHDDFVRGMRALFLPPMLAYSIDGTLAILADTAPASGRGTGGGGGRGTGGGSGRGRGGGGGGGGGRGGGRESSVTDSVPNPDPAVAPAAPIVAGTPAATASSAAPSIEPPASFGIALRSILRGDLRFLTDGVVRALDQGASQAARHADRLGSPQRARDVGIIAGVTVMLMSLKILKVMPGLPVAPGHKNVLFVPLFILAAELTATRWGATLTGATMGIVAFLFGDGKYGIFEVLQHIALGFAIDLLWPIARRLRPSVVVYGLVGLLASVCRFATVVAVMLCLEAREAVYAILAPFGLPHVVFGALSGLVTFVLMQSVQGIRGGIDRGRAAADPTPMAPAGTTQP